MPTVYHTERQVFGTMDEGIVKILYEYPFPNSVQYRQIVRLYGGICDVCGICGICDGQRLGLRQLMDVYRRIIFRDFEFCELLLGGFACPGYVGRQACRP